MSIVFCSLYEQHKLHCNCRRNKVAIYFIWHFHSPFSTKSAIDSWKSIWVFLALSLSFKAAWIEILVLRHGILKRSLSLYTYKKNYYSKFSTELASVTSAHIMNWHIDISSIQSTPSIKHKMYGNVESTCNTWMYAYLPNKSNRIESNRTGIKISR